MTVKIPDPPTPEDAAALAMDRALFGRTVQDAETGTRIDPLTITTARPLSSGRWVVHAPTRPTPYEITLAHHRRPGARTLGAWRNKVALPEVLLDVLVGSDPPETVLTPETIVACGLLAVRTLRATLPALP